MKWECLTPGCSNEQEPGFTQCRLCIERLPPATGKWEATNDRVPRDISDATELLRQVNNQLEVTNARLARLIELEEARTGARAREGDEDPKTVRTGTRAGSLSGPAPALGSAALEKGVCERCRVKGCNPGCNNWQSKKGDNL